jgi:beta-glucosidase
VALDAGKREHLSIELRVGDLSHYDVQSKRDVVDSGRYELLLGASSADIRQKAAFDVAPD